MTDDGRLPDVWFVRDFPVLRVVARCLDESDGALFAEQVADTIEMDLATVKRAGRALQRGGFVTVLESADETIFAFTQVSGSAYVATGLHPNSEDALSGLIELLHQAADQADDEEERTRLRRAADAVGEVARNVMTGVLTAYGVKYGVH